jgi:hypothetical protein
MGLKVVGPESANCIQVTQDGDKWKAIGNAVTKLRTALTAENYLTRWGTIRLTKRRAAVCTWNVRKIISVLSIHGLTSTSVSTTMASILRTHSTLKIGHLCLLDSKRTHVSCRRQQTADSRRGLTLLMPQRNACSIAIRHATETLQRSCRTSTAKRALLFIFPCYKSRINI